MKKNKIIIFDTTLRDGEQAPGAALASSQKLEVARQLEKLGVDVIEAGFPIASGDDFYGVSLVAKNIKNTCICGLARCMKKDILAVRDALIKAKHRRLHIFLATSKIHLKYKFRKAEDEIFSLAKNSLKFSRKYFDDIEFSPEDATRTERDFLFRIIELAIKMGAKTINIPDTVGYSYPQEIYNLIKDIFNNVPNINKAVVSIHCHDDLGMASSNSLSAILAGARQVHCTINGIGERAGNASLEEVVMALRVRRDIFSNFTTQINTKEIIATSRLVSNLTGFLVPPNKAIVGRNAFRHESGIHQDAIIKKRTTYEIINPLDIGLKKTELVLGKHSGRHALFKRLEEMGFRFSQKKKEQIFIKFKELADKKKEVFSADLRMLAEEEIERKIFYKLHSFKINYTSSSSPLAEVNLLHNKKIFTASASGDGPVDACYKAIDKIVKVKVKLLNYKLEAATRGKDAQGISYVEIKYKNKVYGGRGISTDILEASIKAYLDVLNRIFQQ